MKKKIIALATLVAMVCMMFAFSIPTFATYDWTDNIDEVPLPSGSGTENDPFIIMNEDQFWAMSYRNYYGSSSNYGYFGCADCYNNKCNSNHDHYFELGADITFTIWKSPFFKYGFYPIGCYNDSYAFNGKLDGKGHKLVDFHLSPSDGSYWALFGRTKNAKFSNIEFENAVFEYVGDSFTGTFSPVNYSALLVGYAQNTTFENIKFTNCKIEANSAIGFVCGQADNCKFKNIQIDNKSTITSGNTEVGGITGIMKGTGSIEDSTVAAEVAGKSYIGGFVGYVIPSGNNTIYFNNITRSNKVRRTSRDAFDSRTYKLNTMGVFVGASDYGFKGFNIKNGKVIINGNAGNVYEDASTNAQNYLRYTGKYQESDGKYYEPNFITSSANELSYNTDPGFKMPSNLSLGSALSEGNMLIIVGVAAAVVFGLGGFFVGNVTGKKKKLVPAGGVAVENEDDE